MILKEQIEILQQEMKKMNHMLDQVLCSLSESSESIESKEYTLEKSILVLKEPEKTKYLDNNVQVSGIFLKNKILKRKNAMR